MEQLKEKTIALAGDHNGLELKKHLYLFLENKGYNCIDLGPFPEDGKVDYPDYSAKLASLVDSGEISKGILICGTGQGCSIVANKFPNVRAALVHNLESAPLSREHNDANVLCLGSWLTPEKRAEMIVDSWLNTPFGAGRHTPRVEKISKIGREIKSGSLTSIPKISPINKQKIVFTNGVFDVIHQGHKELLEFAKTLGNKLIVGINSDRAVKILKGPDRPINNQETRKQNLLSLGYVNEVVIFDDTEALETINKIKPEIFVKGGEWTAEEVRHRDKIPEEIEIKLFPLIKGY